MFKNIMPLIPQAKFSHLKPPTASERKQAQDKSAEIIGQMRHCRQCRADAVGLLGQDISQTLFETKRKDDSASTPYSYKVAVTSSERDGTIDLHFGQTRKFLIYGFYDDNSVELFESRVLEPGEEQPTIAQAAQLLSDCKFVITGKAGPHAAAELKNVGIEIIQDCSQIDVALKRLTYYA